MPDTYQGTDELKVHLDWESKLIWYVGDRGEVQCVDLEPEEFAAKLAGEVEMVQVLGFHSNAELICKLYDVCQNHKDPPIVQIGTPAVCSRKERSDPKAVLQRMDEVGSRRPSQGGWHDLDGRDFIQYLLVCGTFRSNGEITPEVEEVIKLHPAYPALSFIPTLDWRRTAAVLSHMIDPRWFIDPANPDRSARLRAYFGLTKKNVRHCMLGEYDEDMNYERAKHAFYSWRGTHSLYENTQQPGNFLLRRVARFDNAPLGVLRATHHFITYLKQNWLTGLGGHPELSAPEYLFDGDDDDCREATIAAFKEHMASFHTI
jgi:hypothetical protein